MTMAPLDTTPRKRNADATRASLLVAATAKFAREGYDSVSLREIASEAGVDVALVYRYLGDKDALFAEVLNRCPAPDRFFEGGLDKFGERVARILVLEPLEDQDLTTLLIILNSASSEKAAKAIKRSSDQRFLDPLTKLLPGSDAAVRARLISNIIKGVAIDRVISGDPEKEIDERNRFCTLLTETLQALVDH